MQEVFVKGLVEERASTALPRAEHDVNRGLEPSPSGWSAPCQERVDTKAFTGRGTRPELRQLQAEVDKLSQRMHELSATSKQVVGAQIYLMLHQRHATGYMFLRWREAGGMKRHLSWEQGQAIYGRYTPQLSAWYTELAEQARAVNDAHLRMRRQIKSISLRLSKQKQSIYARPIQG